MFNDIFMPKEAREVEAKFKTAEVAMQVASDRARRCLVTNEFKDYRKSFERVETALMDSLIAYNHQFSVSTQGDTYKYAMKINRLLTKAETVRELLRTIESAAKRKVKE